jgi:hypothetical protein
MLLSCTLDFTGSEPPELREFLAGVTTHLHLKSARLDVYASLSPKVFQFSLAMTNR